MCLKASTSIDICMQTCNAASCDRYMDFFPDISNHSNQILFEKSANYFDAAKGPLRVHSLLPEAKIITIFIDPTKRAYSWYQVSDIHVS